MVTRALATLGPILTPHGRLLLAQVDDAPALPPDLSRRLEESFASGSGHGLLQLGAGEVGTVLPPAFGYWREFAARYVTAVCTLADVGDRAAQMHIPALPDADLESLAAAAPLMTGVIRKIDTRLHGGRSCSLARQAIFVVQPVQNRRRDHSTSFGEMMAG